MYTPQQPAPVTQDKAFDFTGFFTNPVVMQFIQQLLQSVIGVFKGNLSKGTQDELKQKSTVLLKNLETLSDPSFITQLVSKAKDDICNTISTKIEGVSTIVKDSAAKPEELQDMITKAISVGISTGMTTAIEEALLQVEVETNSRFVMNKEDKL